MEKYTASTSFCDKTKTGKVLVNIEENCRDEKECERLNQTNSIYHPESSFRYNTEMAKKNIALVECSSLEEAYERVLGQSVEEFNARQKRKDRKTTVEKVVEGYLKKGGFEAVPLVVQVGNAEKAPDVETCEKIITEYIEEFQKRFPQMVVVSAYIHKDEDRRVNPEAKGTTHGQIYMLPIKEKGKAKEPSKWRGPDTQLGLTEALEQMGYTNDAKFEVGGEKKHDYKNGALAQFQKDFNGLLDEICLKYGIEVDHPQRGKKVSHQDQREYKEGLLTEKVASQKASIEENDEILDFQIAAISSMDRETERLQAELTEAQEKVTHLTAQVKEKTTLLERLEGLFVALQSKVEDFFSTKEKHAKMEATERQKGKPESILHRTFGSARKAREEAESAYSKLKGVPFKGEAVESVESTFQSFEQKADFYKEAVEKVEEELEVEGWEL